MKNIETFYPLSPLQKGLLFHSVFAPESALYFQQLNCTVRGDFDVAAWKSAWQQVVDRHPVLRTGFLWEGLKEPVQVVHRQAALVIEEEDWRALPDAEQHARLDAFLKADRVKGFDLAQPPLMRLALLRTGEESYYFVWSHHHLLLDGWSVQLLLKEVFDCYEAACRQTKPKLTQSRPYRDYIAWLQQQDLSLAESFWRDYLHGFNTPTALGGHTNGHQAEGLDESAVHEEEKLSFTPEETTRLQSFARQHQLTLNTLVQGAWALLLSRYSGSSDVVFGATVSGRPAALSGVEQMLGLFINALPVRVQMSGEESVVEWLRRVQEQQVEARQYEYSPLMEVQRWSELERGQSLFESLLIFKNYPGNASEKNDASRLEVGDVQTFERTNYPLCIALSADERLELVITYDSRRFDGETTRRMAEQFRSLLAEMVADAGRRVKDLQRDGVEGFRLSPQQEHLWLVAAREGGAPYRAACAVRVEGKLDASMLRAAVGKAIARQEILRTGFRQLPGMSIPLQVIGRAGAGVVREQDLSGREREAQEASIASLLREMSDAAREGRVARDESPLRVELLKLSDVEHALIAGLPALCADATTLRNLVGEIARCYEASLKGEELTDEPMPYVVFSEWQNELLESEETEAGKEFWRAQDFSGLLPSRLPFEKNASADAGFAPRSERLEIEASTASRLETVAEECGASVESLLLTCWQTLLCRLTAQDELVVGFASDGRTDEELAAALGLFARYLPLAWQADDALPFDEAARRVAEASREAVEWQECFSWREVAPALTGTTGAAGVTGDAGEPFIPLCFEYAEPAQDFAAGDVTFRVQDELACIDRFKLSLRCVRGAGSLALDLRYDGALFEAESIRRLGAQFETLLRNAVNAPQSPLGELEILGAGEREQLLFEFNQTEHAYPSEKCLHELLSEQAARTPESVAVVYEGERLSYRELEERANRLANYLRAHSVAPDTLVGILLERSVEMVVALYATLKAGGAYVPLDAAYPPERLRLMIEDAGVRVLLTQASLREVLPAHDASVVCLDADWENVAEESAEPPANTTTPDNLAYVIYTSGSTGTPKGAMISHRAICNHMSWMSRRFPLGASDRVLQKTPVSFDASVWEFYAPLLAGATLVMAAPGGHQDAAYLVGAVAAEKVTTLQLVPTMLRVLLEEPGLETCRALKRVFCGGEALTTELRERFYERLPHATLHNLYGPTEACIDATWWDCAREAAERTVPIGRPVDNTQAYVLDAQMRPVPVGVAGELHLGGVCLGRGYLRRPHLSAEKFVPNPFSREPGARLYRTGDLACFRPDGALEYLGRLDHQVKIRGFRIETGEIEAALLAHASVRRCAVVAREETGEAKRLVAYVVADADPSSLTVTDLHRHLRETLPDYMIPASFVMLDELPLTPNGKLDRRRLPAPDDARPELERSFVAPRNSVEETLAAIWAAVLRVEQIGIDDSFFELGGDSILSLQIIARANQAGLRLTPKQLFDNPTIAQLSSVVSTQESQTETEQGTVTGAVPLTPIQHLFFEQELPDAHHYNQSALFEVRQALDAELLAQAVQHLVAHHDALRLRFRRDEQGWQQQNAATEQGAIFSRVDFSGVAEGQQRAAIEEAAQELQTSLDIEAGPLVRVALFDLGAERPARLLIVIHHLAVDGVSWRILLDDLQTVYEQLKRGEAVKLPLKTTPFKRWAELLQGHAQSESTRAELDYWLAESRRQAARLPADDEAGENTEGSAQTVSMSLDEDETRALLQEVPAAFHTQINDVLLTALAQTLAHWTGERSLLVDLEGHGREEIVEDLDLSRTVGWFTTVFPVLLEVEQGDAGQVLKSIKEQLRALPQRGIGYGLLRYLSDDEETRRSLRALPQPEICFNYLGQWDSTMNEQTSLVAAQESSGRGRSGRGRRAYLLDTSGSVSDGRLQMSWTYSENLHTRATVETLADNFMEALRHLIAFCRTPDAGGFTPSDFPRANLNQTELDRLLARIGQGE